MAPASPEGRSPSDSCFCDQTIHEVLDVDQLLRSLAHPCRREILGLLDAKAPRTRDELTDKLGTVPAVDTQITGTEAEVVLRHQHLPTLADAGLITVDDDCWRVERGEQFEVVRDMVEAAVTEVS